MLTESLINRLFIFVLLTYQQQLCCAVVLQWVLPGSTQGSHLKVGPADGCCLCHALSLKSTQHKVTLLTERHDHRAAEIQLLTVLRQKLKRERERHQNNNHE